MEDVCVLSREGYLVDILSRATRLFGKTISVQEPFEQKGEWSMGVSYCHTQGNNIMEGRPGPGQEGHRWPLGF